MRFGGELDDKGEGGKCNQTDFHLDIGKIKRLRIGYHQCYKESEDESGASVTTSGGTQGFFTY